MVEPVNNQTGAPRIVKGANVPYIAESFGKLIDGAGKLLGTGGDVAKTSGAIGSGVVGTVTGTAVATGKAAVKLGGGVLNVSTILAMAPVRTLGRLLENKFFRTGLIVAGVVTAYHAVKNWRQARAERQSGDRADPQQTVSLREQTSAMNAYAQAAEKGDVAEMEQVAKRAPFLQKIFDEHAQSLGGQQRGHSVHSPA